MFPVPDNQLLLPGTTLSLPLMPLLLPDTVLLSPSTGAKRRASVSGTVPVNSGQPSRAPLLFDPLTLLPQPLMTLDLPVLSLGLPTHVCALAGEASSAHASAAASSSACGLLARTSQHRDERQVKEKP